MTPFKDGFGVSTPFEDRDGDILGYHVLGPYERDKYKIVDNALTVALFESEGAALDSETRLSAFNEIVGGYSALYDEVEGEIRIADVSQKDLGAKSLDFMEMLLRLQDIYLLTQERTRNTFIEDVDNRLSSLSIDGLPVKAGQPVSTQLTDVVPDYILTKDGLDKPVALFVVNQNEKLWQAMYLKSLADFEMKTPLSVVALLQSDKIGSAQLRAKADYRLDAVPKWSGDEVAAMGRILRELEVPPTVIH